MARAVKLWCRGVAASYSSSDGCKKGKRVDIELAGDALQAFEGQVALAALDAAHVGAVDAELVGERLLAEAAGLAVGAQVAADRSL